MNQWGFEQAVTRKCRNAAYTEHDTVNLIQYVSTAHRASHTVLTAAASSRSLTLRSYSPLCCALAVAGGVHVDRVAVVPFVLRFARSLTSVLPLPPSSTMTSADESNDRATESMDVDTASPTTASAAADPTAASTAFSSSASSFSSSSTAASEAGTAAQTVSMDEAAVDGRAAREEDDDDDENDNENDNDEEDEDEDEDGGKGGKGKGKGAKGGVSQQPHILSVSALQLVWHTERAATDGHGWLTLLVLSVVVPSV